jgi:hypothetical protein
MSKLRQLINDLNGLGEDATEARQPISITVSTNELQSLLQTETNRHLLTEWCRAWIELNKETL